MSSTTLKAAKEHIGEGPQEYTKDYEKREEIMLVAELHEILSIDSEITELHQKLESLYKQRADLASIKSGASSVSSQTIDDINLDGIDLSL